MNLDIYNNIYKNAKMGYSAVSSIMPKVTDDRLRAELAMQMDGYKKLYDTAASRLKDANQPPKPINALKKLPIKAGIAINTMFDSSASHIAEIVINGSSMGIIDMTKTLNSVNLQNCGEEAMSLGRDTTNFEQQNIERLKSYL